MEKKPFLFKDGTYDEEHGQIIIVLKAILLKLFVKDSVKNLNSLLAQTHQAIFFRKRKEV